MDEKTESKKKHKCPGYGELFFDVLKVIESRGGSSSNDEILQDVIKRRAFSDEIVDEMHPGSTVSTELEYQLAWARTYLRKNAFIQRSRNGVWALTAKGNEACRQGKIDKRDIIRNACAASSGAVCATKTAENPNPLSSEESRPWKEVLANILHGMDPYAFERLTQRLLRECGFDDVSVTKKSGDGGIDGTGRLLMNGIFSFYVAFQCKRYKGPVGAPEIRDFRGSLSQNIEKGVFITTGSFTKAAREEANAPGKQQIDLIDGDDFMNKLAEYGIGLSPRVEYEIDEAFFREFNEKGE